MLNPSFGLSRIAAGTVSALSNRRLAKAAKAVSTRKGYLDGRSLAEVFAWLRPGDLIWNYWVNNHLLGHKPPAFDILFWNADTTKHGELTVLGQPIDLQQVSVDAYIVAGSTDHITPWQNCYRTTALLGGQVRFVLSSSGHIAALVNPPAEKLDEADRGALDALLKKVAKE